MAASYREGSEVQLAISGEAMAHTILQQHPDWAVISIRDARLMPVAFSGHRGQRLDLSFDDVHTSHAERWGYQLPARRDVEAVLKFCLALRRERQVPGKGGQQVQGIIVHCAMGVSRSSAILLGMIICLRTGSRERPGRTQVLEALRLLHEAVLFSLTNRWRDHSYVCPNRRLLALFDRELGLDGVLVREAFGLYWPKEDAETALVDASE